MSRGLTPRYFTLKGRNRDPLVIGKEVGTTPVAAVPGVTGGWITVGEPGYTLPGTLLRKLGLVIVIAASVADAGELIARGDVLANAVGALDLRWSSGTTTLLAAWSVSAPLFGLARPALTPVAGIHVLSGGFPLGLACLQTGQLGVPVGIRAGLDSGSGYVVPLTSDRSVVSSRCP